MQYCAHPYLDQLCNYLRPSFLIIPPIRGSVHILSWLYTLLLLIHGHTYPPTCIYFRMTRALVCKFTHQSTLKFSYHYDLTPQSTIPLLFTEATFTPLTSLSIYLSILPNPHFRKRSSTRPLHIHTSLYISCIARTIIHQSTSTSLRILPYSSILDAFTDLLHSVN